MTKKELLEQFGELQMTQQENGIEDLVEFEFKGQAIVNPFVSENCIRSVNPIEYYGKENFENWKKKAIEKIKGENNMQLKKETFELDGIDLSFEGYFDKNDKGWNGWLNPYFTKEVAQKIYEEIMEFEDGYELTYSDKKKVFKMANEDETDLFDSCKAIEIDGMELYQVGRHNFTWGFSNE